jgi:ectoine hydroxylase-related dioxygenase (phytanoyl-CoA dioxygenase family)
VAIKTARYRPEQPGRHLVYHEDSPSSKNGRILQRIEDLTAFHAGFRSLYCDGRLIDAVSKLFGERALLFKDKINFKLPGGQGFKAHQDVQAGWHVYARYFISTLVSIDRSTEENGCIEMAPGWHDRGLIGEEWTPLDEASTSQMGFEMLPTNPGDVVFFDCFVPHRSGDNRTSEPRRVLYVSYNRASEGDHRVAYYADKRKSFPPDIEREPGKSYVFRV